ncbi:hypothetical protein M3231_00680 [Neobacillus mesonae]|nr:hypothetical protein [Neobacillus mesonae]
MPKAKTVYCVHCNAEIESKDDLVVSLSFLSLLAYHNHCYAKAMKGCQSIILSDQPVNGTAANGLAALSILLSIVAFVFLEWYIGAILVVVPLIRLCSWYEYERHLES